MLKLLHLCLSIGTFLLSSPQELKAAEREEINLSSMHTVTPVCTPKFLNRQDVKLFIQMQDTLPSFSQEELNIANSTRDYNGDKKLKQEIKNRFWTYLRSLEIPHHKGFWQAAIKAIIIHNIGKEKSKKLIKINSPLMKSISSYKSNRNSILGGYSKYNAVPGLPNPTPVKFFKAPYLPLKTSSLNEVVDSVFTNNQNKLNILLGKRIRPPQKILPNKFIKQVVGQPINQVIEESDSATDSSSDEES